MDHFIALDVETANYDYSSICQVGMVEFLDGKINQEWNLFLKPHGGFNDFHIGLHGITPEKVKNAPSFLDSIDFIADVIGDKPIVTYTSFDESAFRRAAHRSATELPAWTWLDASRVTRLTWDKYAKDGYGLAVVAVDLGIPFFSHHDAIADARVTGEILLRAFNETNTNLSHWLGKAYEEIDPSKDNQPNPKIKNSGNPNGRFFGETIIFTGEISMPRVQAAEMAATAGFNVIDSVNQSITTLVVGSQNINNLKGHEKSSKQIYVEKLISNGKRARILSESDFMNLLSEDLPVIPTPLHHEINKDFLKNNGYETGKTVPLEKVGFLFGKRFVKDSWRLPQEVIKFIEDNGGEFDKDITYSTYVYFCDKLHDDTAKSKKANKYLHNGAFILFAKPKDFQSIPIFLKFLRSNDLELKIPE